MATRDNDTQEGAVPIKLQRFLMTVARRKGIEQISIGAIITTGGKLVLSDRFRTFPHKQLEGDDFEDTLRSLAKEIGLTSFSVKQYVGSFDYPTPIGTTAKQYNFEIELNSPLRKLNQGFVLVDVEKSLPEFLSPSEARLLTLVLEKKKRTY